jgi:hypothetical protein
MSNIKARLIRFLETVPAESSRDSLIRMLWSMRDDETIETYSDFVEKHGVPSPELLASQSWNIQRKGSAWPVGNVLERDGRIPAGARIEIHYGKLLFNDDDRMTLLALLLENVGIDNAVTLGNPEDWLDAAAKRLGIDIVFDLLQEKLGKTME